MDYKNDIEILLEKLKTAGYTRRRIEAEMGNAAFHIDQVLARGGNKGFLKRLDAFTQRILRNATMEAPTALREPVTAYSAEPASTQRKRAAHY